MNLKTLKDIECEVCADNGFSDIVCTSKILKQEAIKWIKEWNKTIKSDIVRCPICPEYEDARIAVYNECSFSIKWAKHFFNIKEEDLK